jgi:hypothetical protein
MPRTRGAAWVREVLRTHGEEIPVEDRRPMSAAQLEAIRDRIPPSLATWLGFHTESPSGEVSLVDGGGLAVRSTAQLFEELVTSESAGEEWEEGTREAMNELAATVPGDALLVREPSGEDHFLYLGGQPLDGEHPVLILEHEALRVGWSGFDAYVADRLGALDPDEEEEREACARVSQQLFPTRTKSG